MTHGGNTSLTAKSDRTIGRRLDANVVLLQRRLVTGWNLVCFPWAGAGAAVFAPWRSLLPSSVSLSAVRLPGRENRSNESAFETINAAATAIARDVTSLGLDETVFFGHSLGALVALETARQLEVAGCHQPALLIVSASKPPGITPFFRDKHDSTHQSEPEEVREIGRLPSARLREALLRTLRLDIAMAESSQLECVSLSSIPIVVYGGMGDAGFGHGAVEQWHACSQRDLRVRWFEGGHFYLLERPTEVLRAIVNDGAAHVARRQAEQPGAMGMNLIRRHAEIP